MILLTLIRIRLIDFRGPNIVIGIIKPLCKDVIGDVNGEENEIP